MSIRCYLCGDPIEADIISRDHVVPKQFINRSQPKVKGFDYPGVLPTHQECNNQFGPEAYCKKALIIIRALHDERCFLKAQHRENRTISIIALNSDYFPGFTESDLQYFGFIDVRHEDIQDWATPAYFAGKKKTNLKKDALHTALAVLTKSAAALLISRHLKAIPPSWRVVAITYVGAADVDFDELLGDTVPFDIGVKVWIRQMQSKDWIVFYRVEDVLIYFLFSFSCDNTVVDDISKIFEDADALIFEGRHLNQLIGYQWRKIQPR